MNIYLVSQSTNTDYDTYDSMVVIAQNEKQAALIHPEAKLFKQFLNELDVIKKSLEIRIEDDDYEYSTWTAAKNVTTTLIGVAHEKYKEPTIVMTSFNAG